MDRRYTWITYGHRPARSSFNAPHSQISGSVTYRKRFMMRTCADEDIALVSTIRESRLAERERLRAQLVRSETGSAIYRKRLMMCTCADEDIALISYYT